MDASATHAEPPVARVSNETRNRLRWQCRRGMLELDILLQGFLANGFDTLSEQEQGDFHFLLETPDQVLLGWLMGTAIPTDGAMHDIVKKIRHAASP